MKLTELHSNEALRLEAFPIAKKQIFLANAAICPLPAAVGEAMHAFVDHAVHAKVDLNDYNSLYEETRKLAANLLVCKPETIALIGPTSVGLSLVANGLTFKKGENVVYYHDDYPSNAVVWMNLEKKGVEVRSLEVAEPGLITVDSLRPLVDSRTRLVALASAHFMSGYRLDLDAIGEWLKTRGVLFSVDGIQTTGAVRTRVEYVDFLSADAHKWLLGPTAIGIFHVNPNVQDQLAPSLLGWNNVICPEFVTPERIVLKEDAGRYEAGCPNLVGLVGFHEGLKLLNQFTIEAIEETITGYTRQIREAVRRKGYALACSEDEHLSGISTFRKDRVDMAALHEKLTGAGIISSLRTSPDQRQWIRYSPHCYNTKSEIEEALSIL